MRRDRAVADLTWRETRRGGVIVVAALAGLVVAFGSVFETFASTLTAGSGESDSMIESPAVRALYGSPDAIATQGGFIVWRGALILPVLATLWAATTTTRVLRGDEDAGRADLALAHPLRRGRMTALQLLVLAGWCLVLSAALAVTFIIGGSESDGALLYSIGLGLLALTFVGVGACASQLFGNRRLASGVTGAVLGGSMVVRIAADSSDDRGWMRWLTPFGWLENLHAFGANDVAPLLLLGFAPCLLFVVAAVLLARRDVGTGTIRTTSRARARTRLLTGPLPFAWRQQIGGVVGWSVGMTFYGLLIGAITASGVEFITENPELETSVEQMGLTGLSTPEGFVASMAGFLAVAFAILAVSSLGRCHDDEVDHRLDLPYAHAVTRARWLRSVALAGVVATAVAVVASIVATWVGALAGSADLALADVTIATLNVLPATALFFGLGVLLLGVVPSMTVPVSVGAAIAVYVMSFLGPLLDWPTWLQDLNPFQQLGNAPVSAVAWTAVVIILATATVEIAVGFLAYERRDLA